MKYVHLRLRQLQSTISKTETRQAGERERRTRTRAVAAESAAPALNAHKPPAKEPVYVDPQLLTGDLRQLQTKGINLFVIK
jgi:hypothetical protein